MSDRVEAIKGLEQFKYDFKTFCGNNADWKKVDDALAMLKEQGHKDRMFHALEEDWKRLKEQEKQKFFVDENGKITPLPVVVRCKDCKHFDGIDCKVNDIVNIMNTEWFCADGERKPTQTNAKSNALDVR